MSVTETKPLDPIKLPPLKNEVLPAGLYIVATPIGNLEDITLRAIRVLSTADIIACEDTRVAGRLMSGLGLKKQGQFSLYNEQTGPKPRQNLLQAIEQSGQSVALISDSGTPLISDPGYRIVHEARQKNLPVFPIPGASAVTAAISVSGLPSDSFTFYGFLPTATGDRRHALETALSGPATTALFYESPNRIIATLEQLTEIEPEADIVVGREITKRYETFLSGKPAEVLHDMVAKGPVKGEIVLLIHNINNDKKLTDDEIKDKIIDALKTQSVRDAVRAVSAITDTPRSHVYELALTVKKDQK